MLLSEEEKDFLTLIGSDYSVTLQGAASPTLCGYSLPQQNQSPPLPWLQTSGDPLSTACPSASPIYREAPWVQDLGTGIESLYTLSFAQPPWAQWMLYHRLMNQPSRHFSAPQTKPSYRWLQWHPSPVLLPGESHGRRSLVGCSPWGR